MFSQETSGPGFQSVSKESEVFAKSGEAKLKLATEIILWGQVMWLQSDVTGGKVWLEANEK